MIIITFGYLPLSEFVISDFFFLHSHMCWWVHNTALQSLSSEGSYYARGTCIRVLVRLFTSTESIFPRPPPNSSTRARRRITVRAHPAVAARSQSHAAFCFHFRSSYWTHCSRETPMPRRWFKEKLLSLLWPRLASLSSSAQAAITKYHRLGGLKHKSLFSHSSGG